MKKVYDAVVTVNYYIPKFFDSADVVDLHERNFTKDYALRYFLLDAPVEKLTHRQTIEKVVFTERETKKQTINRLVFGTLISIKSEKANAK